MTAPLLHQILGRIEGLTPDKHAEQRALWGDGRNVEVGLNGVRKMAGWSAPLTPSGAAPVRGLGQLLRSSGQELFWGDQTNLYRWNTATVSSVGSGFAGNLNETVLVPASTWSIIEWGNWMVATNGVDALQVYKGTSFAALTGTPPTTAEILLKLGAYVLAFNTDLGNTVVEWCDADDIEDWTLDPAKTSGNLTIRDFDSAIIAAVHLKDRIAVYGKDRMVVWSFVGTPFIFGYKPGLQGIGAVSKKSVVEAGQFNYGFGTRGFFQTDGVGYNYIDDGLIRKFVQDDINWAQASKINGFHNAEKTSIEWYYPTASSSEPDQGVSYNYKTKAWTILDHGRTSSDERRIFAYPIVADAAGAIFFKNFGVDADGTAMTSYVQTHPIPFYRNTQQGFSGRSYGDVDKFIDEVRLSMKTFTGRGLKIRYGLQDRLDDPIYWVDAAIVDDPSAPSYPMLTTRWLTIRIESDQVGDDWSLEGFSIYGNRVGGFG